MLLAVLLLLCMLGAIVPRSGRRADSMPAGWFQLASYRNGTVAHLTPVRGRIHAEDEHGEYACNPRSGSYPLDNGRMGRALRASQRLAVPVLALTAFWP